jgi:hypothetical protein
MKRPSTLLAIALTLGVLVTSTGWFLTARPDDSSERVSCRFDAGVLVLGYTYGSDEVVTTSLEVRQDVVVVSVSRSDRGADSMSPLYRGEARYSSVEPGTPVMYPDGRRLECPDRSSA